MYSGGGGLEKGSKVACNYHGCGYYYPGVITRCWLNDTFDIDYDDGDKETRVAKHNIRLIGGAGNSGVGYRQSGDTECSGLEKGSKVTCNFHGSGYFYPGVITRCWLDGTFDIDYDDGDKESRVKQQYIRLIGGGGGGGGANATNSFARNQPRNGEGGGFEKGARVVCNYHGDSYYFPGVISRCRLDGTFDIDYDDGDKESHVDRHNIRLVEAAPDTGGNTRNQSRNATGGGFEEGSKVACNYRGGGYYYPGVITRSWLDGTYDIDYDDGDKETRVETRDIRLISAGAAGGGGGDGGRSKREHITCTQLALIPQQHSTGCLEEGAKVECNYHGRGRYYPGVIAYDRRNGTFDIDYDDGDQELRVDERDIRLVGVGGAGAGGGIVAVDKRSRNQPRVDSVGRLEEGAKVECNYHGRGRYYPGVIAYDRRNGTFDIDYDDGDYENHVDELDIRLVRIESCTSHNSSQLQFAEGTEVECNYHGRGRFYPGMIVRCRNDGTFDVEYDDGDKETRVHDCDIRVLRGSRAGGGADADAGALQEGARVECNYHGRGRYYPGVIAYDRRNGTLDIDYDDGDYENRVEKRFIRLLEDVGIGGHHQVTSKSSRFDEGTRVACNYHGRGRYYPGVIAYDRRNGTFDIDYDDGDYENRVDERDIRLVGSGSGGSFAASRTRSYNSGGWHIE